MALKQQLITQITAGKIIFDSPDLKTVLLGENAGQIITVKLQQLILALSQEVNTHIRISSLVRDEGHHGERRAVDLGNEEVAAELLNTFAVPAMVILYDLDEIIFDAGGGSPVSRNRWNYDNGQPHVFNEATLLQHRNHIHLSVKP